MPAKRNNVVPNGHFHKHWQQWVRTWFNQPARKKRRHDRRVKKARQIAPKPVGGPLRPIVHCPTIRYNMKVRTGRGFTLQELKLAKIPKHFAPTIGIAVDHRRKNRSMESLRENVQRLKEYKSKLILFPRDKKYAGTINRFGFDEATEEQMKMAKQLPGPVVMPVKKTFKRMTSHKPTEDEKNFRAVEALHMARYWKKSQGRRLKKAAKAAGN